ncbi:MAG TPA: hypothetical protein VFF30_09860 [Nitrososphaerales archaeon]|nr:hypothetical protein [Nitrososphaerales archaeon]
MYTSLTVTFTISIAPGNILSYSGLSLISAAPFSRVLTPLPRSIKSIPICGFSRMFPRLLNDPLPM